MNNIKFIILAAAVVILGGAVIWQQNQITQLQKDLRTAGVRIMTDEDNFTKLVTELNRVFATPTPKK